MPSRPSPRLPRLPPLLQRKLYKTSTTRGADDDHVYQNRVARNSTVLIHYDSWTGEPADELRNRYERGFILLVSPHQFLATDARDKLTAKGFTLGTNALVFYETREQWLTHNPNALGWEPAISRTSPLGGQFVARVPAITSRNGEKINLGYTTTKQKGAGIRVYEYASAQTAKKCVLQLEALYWLCADAVPVAVAHDMSATDAGARRSAILCHARESGLLDLARLRMARAVNTDDATVCPLCLEPLSAASFFTRVEQASGREVHDLTVTEVSLFHVRELRVGALNHLPYNVAWGHHHCNVVVRDSGIEPTLRWLRAIIDRNVSAGLFPT